MSKGGKRAGSGRKKGVPNKIGGEIKEAIALAFVELGGKDYLVELGKTDPRTFCTLAGKLIPTQIAGDEDSPVKHVLEVRWAMPSKDSE